MHQETANRLIFKSQPFQNCKSELNLNINKNDGTMILNIYRQSSSPSS